MSKPTSSFFRMSEGHIILWTVILFFALALAWSRYATLDEVTVAEGQVIPASKIQIIQHLEGGIIKKINVREGQVVDKNDVLMVIDDTRFAGELKSNELRKIELSAKIMRLNAEVHNKPFIPTPDLLNQAPNIVRTEKALFESRQAELKTLKNRRDLLAKEIEMTEPLVKDGVVSEVDLLRLRQRLVEMDGKIHNMRSMALDELNQANSELSRFEGETDTLHDRVSRTMLRSPVRGIIKQIHIATVGAVVQPGMALMEIVPLEDTLRVEARVRPADIGFIHPGQPAVVKITAYDFAIYGGLEGKVEHISADTSKDEEGNPYFEIWVRTKKAYLGTEKNKLSIIPGMQASVDILTGKKTVLDYILKPVLRAKANALRER